MKRERVGRIFMEILTFVLLIIFFFPFFLVIINSAKNISDILESPLGFSGAEFAKFFNNIKTILDSTYVRYLNSFMNSAIITTFSLVAIGVFSGMAAWVLVRTKTKY